MTNQSLLPLEKHYPERLIVPDALTSWDVTHATYAQAPVYGDGRRGDVYELLEAAGVEVLNEPELRILGALTTKQAQELYGPQISKIRNPLGRTGINGTGLFYKAGEAPAADMAIVRENPRRGRELALIFNRKRWGLPGGFCEPEEITDRQTAAVREAFEETGLDLTELTLAYPVQTLVQLAVKPGSKRSCDYGFITTQVEAALLADCDDGEKIKAGDDAETADWFTETELDEFKATGKISTDHYGYAQLAFRHLFTA